MYTFSLLKNVKHKKRKSLKLLQMRQKLYKHCGKNYIESWKHTWQLTNTLQKSVDT